MNYVFYDFETSGNNKDFDQILQIGAILTDSALQVIDKINISCRLKKDVVPAPEALLINKISIDQLKTNDTSHYNLIEQLKKSLKNGRLLALQVLTVLALMKMFYDKDYLNL